MAPPKKTTPSKATVAGTKAVTQKISSAPAAEIKTIKVATPAPVAIAPAKPVIPAPVRSVAPVAPPSRAVVSARTGAKTISQSEWRSMVEQAAYYIAEKNGFTGNPEDHWAAAEAKIRADLDAKGVKVV